MWLNLQRVWDPHELSMSHVRAGEYVVAEKVVAEDEETGLLHAASGLRSNGSLHSVGTHDSSSSLDWTIDAVPSKARHLTVLVPLYPALLSTLL